MELAGMVVMGEYSNGCICEIAPRTNRRAGTEDKLVYVGANGAMAAVAGVHRQKQKQEQKQEQEQEQQKKKDRE